MANVNTGPRMKRALRDLICAFLEKQAANPMWNVLVKTRDGASVNPIERLMDDARTAQTVSEIHTKAREIFAIAEKQPQTEDADLIKQIVEGLRAKFDEQFKFFELLEAGQFRDALNQSIEKCAPSMLDGETRKPKLKIRASGE